MAETAPAAAGVPLFNVEKGEWEEHPPEQAQALVAGGTHALRKGRVEVVDAQGRRGSIDASEAPQAFGQWGYRYFSPEEAEKERQRELYGDREVSAAAAGLARGATLGLSDKALTATGAVRPETLRGLSEENPVASVGGEVVGSILPALIPGGQAAPAGAVARLGARVGAGVLERGASRVVAMGAQGALEGGFYGLGKAITEDSLGQADATAEKVLADVGMGVFFGGATGVFAEKVGQRTRAMLMEDADDLTRAIAGTADDVAPPPPRATDGTVEGAEAAARGAPAPPPLPEGGPSLKPVDAAAPPPGTTPGERARDESGRFLTKEETAKRAAKAAQEAEEAARAAAPEVPPSSAPAEAAQANPYDSPDLLSMNQVKKRIVSQKRDWTKGKGEGLEVEALPSNAPRKGGGVYWVHVSELDDVPAVAWKPSRTAEAVAKRAEGGVAPPITLDQGSGAARSIRDGNHRLALARAEGDEWIKVRFGDDKAARIRVDRPRGESPLDDAVAPMDLPDWKPRRPGAPPVAAPAAGAADDAARAAAPEGAPVTAAPEAPPVAGPSSADDAARAAAPETPPPGAPPPPPGAAGAAPPGGEGPRNPFDDFDRVLADDQLGAKARKSLEEGVNKYGQRVRRLMEDLGLQFPSAEEFVLRDLDFKKAALQRLREKGLEKSAPRLLLEDARYAKAITAEDKVALLRTKIREGSQEIEQGLRKLDSAAKPEELVDLEAVANRLVADVADPLARGPAGNDGVVNRILDEAQKLQSRAYRTLPDGSRVKVRVSLADAEAIKRSFDPFAKFDASTQATMTQAYRDIRRVLREEVEQRADAIAKRAGGELDTQWRQGKTLFGGMKELEKEAAKRLEDARVANRFFSLTDNMAGLAAFAAGGGPTPLGLAMGAAGAVLNQWGRTRLAHVMALQMKRLETDGAASVAAKSFRKAVQKADEAAQAAGASSGAAAPAAVPGAAGAAAGPAAAGGSSAAPQAFGGYTDTLRRAAQLGDKELWAVHVAMSADDKYQRVLEDAGLASYTATPEEDDEGQRRATAVARLESSVLRTQDNVERAVDGFLSGDRGEARTMPTAVAMKRAEAVRKLAERPEALLEQVAQRTAGMGRLAPNTAAAVSTKVQAAVAFLSQAAPKPPPMPLDVPALRRTWRPSDVELSKFARKLSAVENPVGVLRRMAAGAVTREEVDAVRAVYPSLYEDMRNTLVAKLSEQKKPLDYRRTVALSHVLGEPLDSTLTPQAVAFYQANHAAKAEQPQRRPSGGRVQERLGSEMTDAQRISNRSART